MLAFAPLVRGRARGSKLSNSGATEGHSSTNWPDEPDHQRLPSYAIGDNSTQTQSVAALSMLRLLREQRGICSLGALSYNRHHTVELA